MYFPQDIKMETIVTFHPNIYEFIHQRPRVYVFGGWQLYAVRFKIHIIHL